MKRFKTTTSLEIARRRDKLARSRGRRASTNTEQCSRAIDFSQPRLRVRYVFDPTKTGHTTVRLARLTGRDYALVELRSGEVAQIPVAPHRSEFIRYNDTTRFPTNLALATNLTSSKWLHARVFTEVTRKLELPHQARYSVEVHNRVMTRGADVTKRAINRIALIKTKRA